MGFLLRDWLRLSEIISKLEEEDKGPSNAAMVSMAKRFCLKKPDGSESSSFGASVVRIQSSTVQSKSFGLLLLGKPVST